MDTQVNRTMLASPRKDLNIIYNNDDGFMALFVDFTYYVRCFDSWVDLTS